MILKAWIIFSLFMPTLNFEIYEWIPPYILDRIPLWTRCYINRPDRIVRSFTYNASESLFGQPFVYTLTETVYKHFKQPRGPLLISFNGPEGVGKNFIAGKLAHHIYYDGYASPYVIYFSGPKDLTSDNYYVKKRIKDVFQKSVTYCPHSLFIFDEVDKMTNGILDNIIMDLVIKAPPKYDFSKSIFLFISNIGSNKIMELLSPKCKDDSYKSKLLLDDFNEILKNENFISDGGLKGAYLISKGFFQLFLPFLPLDESDVKFCIKVSARHQRIPPSPELDKFVLNELFFSNENDCKYSLSGCKGVDQAVARFKLV